MKKGERSKRPSRDGHNKKAGGLAKGPGTLPWRIDNMKKRLKPDQVKRAEELAESEDWKVLKLAWYITSQRRADDKDERLIERYQRGLQRLLGSKANRQDK